MLLASPQPLISLALCLALCHCGTSKNADRETTSVETKRLAINKPTTNVLFRFAPPTPLNFEVSYQAKITLDLGDGKVVENRQELDFAVNLIATIDGYAVRRKTLKLDMWHEGEKHIDFVEKLDIDFPITFLLKSDGRMSKVMGYEEWFAGAKRRLTPEQIARIAPDGETMAMRTAIQSERDAWDERRGYLVGQTLAPGEPYSLEVDRSLGPGGPVTYTECKFVRLASKLGRRLALVRCYMANSPRSFREHFGFNFTGAKAVALPIKSGRQIAMRRDRWLDPETGLIYEEEMTLVDKSKEISMDQHRVYTFRYPGLD